MNFINFASLVRKKTRTNSTTLTDADLLLYANTFKDEIAEMLSKEVGEDIFGLRLTRNLVANQREYDLPSDVMARIKYIEAKLDGTNWVTMHETDLNEYGKTTDESTIIEAYQGKDAAFDLWDRSFFILSSEAIEAVTDGLKLWAILFPADFTDLTLSTDLSTNPTTTSHGFPRQFHELLARRISIEWKSNRDKPLPLSEQELNYDKDLRDKISSMKDANLDRSTEASIPYNDGTQY